MLETTQRSSAETIVEFFEFLELDPAVNEIAHEDRWWWNRLPNGRFGIDILFDFFAFGLPAEESISRALAFSQGAPHWLEMFGEMENGEASLFAAAGYEPLGEWTIMRRTMSASPPPAPIPVELVTDAETEAMLAELQHARPDLTHPVRPGQYTDPRFVHCWIPVDGVAAAIGQAVILEGCAYLCEMVTFPDYRRRGFASAIFQSLLLHAYERGAREAILISTPMARGLYQSHGFSDVAPLFAFEWHSP